MITITIKDYKEIQLSLMGYRKKAPLVIARALNRAVMTARKVSGQLARKTYTIKQKDITKTFKIQRASRNQFGAALISRGNLEPLDHFKYSPALARPGNPPKAIRVSVKKGNLTKFLHAFVANVNGPKLFQRVGKERLPISRIMGPAVPEMLNNPMIREWVERDSADTYYNRLDHEIKRVLEGNP
jgi:hypothetical protein